MLKQDNEPQLVDTTDLTAADWTEIDKIKQAYANGGERDFEKALDALCEKSKTSWLRVVLAYYPTGRPEQ